MPSSQALAQPRVLAIVVNWNKKPFVDRLLGDLARLDRPPDRILVVDNASTDGSVAMIREKYPHVDLLCHSENLGGTGGFNSGMRWGLERGGFGYFWLLDNDVVIHPGALSGLLEVAEADEKVGCVGSRVAALGQPERTQEVGIRIEWPTGTLRRVGTGDCGVEGPSPGTQVYDVDYVASCSLLARVKAVEHVGLWDPGYFLFYDDIEWGVRFNRAGWTVKATTASVVEHESFHDRRSTQPLWMRYQWLRNALYFMHAFCPRETRARTLAHVFRRILTDMVNFRLSGQSSHARCLWTATMDFFRSRRGPNTHKFPSTPGGTSETGDSSNPSEAELPDRRGRILVVAWSNADLIRRAVAALRARFPRHQVEVLIPNEVNPMDVFEIEGLHRRPTRTVLQRVSLARWARGRYDAIARHDGYFPFAFESLLPASILFSNAAELTIHRNRRGEFMVRLLARPFVLAGAIGLMLLALLKPRPRVNYFPWTRASSGK